MHGGRELGGSRAAGRTGQRYSTAMVTPDRLILPPAADSAAARRKTAVRAKVEHPFLYVKRRFGYAKVRYRGLAKNRERLSLLFGLANLLIAERYAAA